MWHLWKHSWHSEKQLSWSDCGSLSQLFCQIFGIYAKFCKIARFFNFRPSEHFRALKKPIQPTWKKVPPHHYSEVWGGHPGCQKPARKSCICSWKGNTWRCTWSFKPYSVDWNYIPTKCRRNKRQPACRVEEMIFFHVKNTTGNWRRG